MLLLNIAVILLVMSLLGLSPLYILQSLKESKKGVMGDFDYAE